MFSSFPKVPQAHLNKVTERNINKLAHFLAEHFQRQHYFAFCLRRIEIDLAHSDALIARLVAAVRNKERSWTIVMFNIIFENVK